MAPDYADIDCGVTTKAKTAKDATDANSRAMAAVAAALHGAGIEQKDIQTTRFSLQPVYAPPQPNTEPKLTGFSVSNQFRVTIRQIGNVGDILDRLIAAGATDVGSVEFLHSDTSKALDQARTAAIADAKRKAELYAQAAGLTLGRRRLDHRRFRLHAAHAFCGDARGACYGGGADRGRRGHFACAGNGRL